MSPSLVSPALVFLIAPRHPVEPRQSKTKQKEVGRQTTLFGLPPAQPAEKATGRKKKSGTSAVEELQDIESQVWDAEVCTLRRTCPMYVD